MPLLERWDNLPERVRQHLIERMRDRAISISDLNQHSYVGNHPLLRADLDGHCWPPSACAAKLSAYIQIRQDSLAANSMTSSPALVAFNTFASGVTADLAEGAADVLRLGNGTASAVENAKQGNYLAAASDLAQDGGRAASVILTVTAIGGKGKCTQRRNATAGGLCGKLHTSFRNQGDGRRASGSQFECH